MQKIEIKKPPPIVEPEETMKTSIELNGWNFSEQTWNNFFVYCDIKTLFFSWNISYQIKYKFFDESNQVLLLRMAFSLSIMAGFTLTLHLFSFSGSSSSYPTKFPAHYFSISSLVCMHSSIRLNSFSQVLCNSDSFSFLLLFLFTMFRYFPDIVAWTSRWLIQRQIKRRIFPKDKSNFSPRFSREIQRKHFWFPKR